MKYIDNFNLKLIKKRWLKFLMLLCIKRNNNLNSITKISLFLNLKNSLDKS
jgi:hypothetical protein